MEKTYMEDYTEGEKFISPGRTMTEADIIAFASLTGDWHPIHTDIEYAKKTPFGERIAHGMLVLAMGSALVFRLGPNITTPKTFIAFYGFESIRFMNPVKIGDTIHLVTEIVEIKAKDDKRGLVTSKGTIINQRGEECAVFVGKVLCGRKPQG